MHSRRVVHLRNAKQHVGSQRQAYLAVLHIIETVVVHRAGLHDVRPGRDSHVPRVDDFYPKLRTRLQRWIGSILGRKVEHSSVLHCLAKIDQVTSVAGSSRLGVTTDVGHLQRSGKALENLPRKGDALP